MRQIQRRTGQKKKSPAVSRALEEYLRMGDRQQFIEKVLAGQTDYSRTDEELEAKVF